MAYSIVSTDGGLYRGLHLDGVHSFLGVRYGADTRSRRFRPSVPPAPHQGIRDATRYGPAALQFDSRTMDGASIATPRLYFPRGGGQTEGLPTSEDCLLLNIWTPSMDASAKLPVIVWVHGGAFRVGSASATATDGASLAEHGCVVISVGHRLGIPGFSPLGHLLGEEFADSGSAGIGDLVLALEWVAGHAARFGGDPDRVTVMGQSGGGAKVSALLSSPRARGLLHRAAILSGAGPILDPDQGRAQTDRVLHAMGLSEATAAEVLDVAPDRILDAQAKIVAQGGFDPGPVADGPLLEPDRRDEISAGVPVLVGHATHDWSFLVADAPWYASLTERDLEERLLQQLPGADPGLIAAYRAKHPDEAAQLLISRVLTDHSFGRAAGMLAEARANSGSPVYRYELRFETDAGHSPLGATHCLEIPLLFGTSASIPLAGRRPGVTQLEREVPAAFLAFANTGVPVDPSGSPWPAFVPGAPSTMVIDHPEWSIVHSLPARDSEPALLG